MDASGAIHVVTERQGFLTPKTLAAYLALLLGRVAGLAGNALAVRVLAVLFVPYFLVNAAGSAARSAFHCLAAFLTSVAARPSRLATHAFVAVDALLAGCVSMNVFVPICAFSPLHAASNGSSIDPLPARS